MKIYELAKEVNPYVVEMRRYFHEHPELSNQEDKTIERIGQELAGMGIEYEVVPHGGIVAILEGKTPGKGKTVLLRADCRCAAGPGDQGEPGWSPCLLLQGGWRDARLRP